jgi:hypothetical protein
MSFYPGQGTVAQAKVVDAFGRPVVEVDAIKRGGAWPWVGMLNGRGDLLWAVAGTAALLLLVGVIYERERSVPPVEGTSPSTRGPVLWLLLAVPVVGWILLLALPSVGATRRWGCSGGSRWSRSGSSPCSQPCCSNGGWTRLVSPR